MAADEFTCATGAGRSVPARGPLVPLSLQTSWSATPTICRSTRRALARARFGLPVETRAASDEVGWPLRADPSLKANLARS